MADPKRPTPEPEAPAQIPDYYEFLEISPQASQDTIHRVYRFLAARYHPDHAETGDIERFALLTSAYKVLSDPARRTEYNTQRALRPCAFQDPMSSTVDFMDQVEGDLNRRLAVLTILYYRRRLYPDRPEVSLAEIEKRMGFPRDYLDFTMWYLQKKKFITRADNAEFTLTVDGVDFIESQRTTVPLLERLLTSGSQSGEPDASHRLPVSGEPSPNANGGWQTPVEVSAARMHPSL